MSRWTYPIPVYVTRKNPEGVRGTVFVPPWIMLPAMYVTLANFFLWGGYGLYEVGVKIFA